MKTRRTMILCGSVFVLLSVLLLAQQPTGSISGLVRDPSGAVVPHGSVTVTQPSTGFLMDLKTTETGLYVASNLLPGNYQLKFRAEGFKTTVANYLVEVGRVTSGDLQLELGSQVETVNVDAQAVAVNPVQTSLEGVIADQMIRDLPANGRNFMDIGQLVPGAQLLNYSGACPPSIAYTTLSLGGQDGTAVRITQDGLDISHEVVGTNAMNISQDSIREYQVSRSALDPSTGLTGIGAVNVVTKSGANDLHGTGFFFFRNDKGAARVGDIPTPFDREQGGFNLGGPLRRDKLFWFMSYEQNNQDGAIATQVGGFPQFTGAWQTPFDERMANGRLDWNITPSLRAFFRFTHNFSVGLGTGESGIGGVNLSPFASQSNVNQTAAGLDWSHGRFTHSFRFGYLNFSNYTLDGESKVPGIPYIKDSTGRPTAVGFTPMAGFSGVYAPFIGPSMMVPMRILQHNHEYRYDGSFSFDRHSLRWGALTNRIVASFNAPWAGVSPEIDISPDVYNYNICGSDIYCYPVTDSLITNGLGGTTEIPALGYPDSGMRNNRIHWYLADNWRVSPRLNINAGVRYVYEPGQNHPDLAKPALLDQFQPGLSQRDRKDKTNFAPHLGIAWDPTGSGKWVIRAGAGVYYDPNFMNTTVYSRGDYLPPGISWMWVLPPFLPVKDPLTGRTIFDMNGADPNAVVTPGRNWVSGCQDPRFLDGRCPLGTPGLMEAVWSGFNEYKAASLRAAAQFPSGPTQFEINRWTSNAFEPDYQTPYTIQFNVGFQRELRRGLLLSADFVRSRGLHYPLGRDLNHTGAAYTLNTSNAMAAMQAVHSDKKCPAGPAGVDCAITHGATIEDYANNGLGKGEAASPAGPNTFFAFPGSNPAFNHMTMYGSQGVSDYRALQISLEGKIPDLSVIKNWNLVASYSLSRMKGVSDSREWAYSMMDNDNLYGFYGPATMDRSHNFSLGSLFQVPGGIRLNSIWRVMSALPQNILIPIAKNTPAEIFYTDFNGDGTVGDCLPGTTHGSFGRNISNGEALNQAIDNYNNTQAGHLTPAGMALVKAGLFTKSQLIALGAVSPQVKRAPDGQVGLDSFITTDLRISRPIRLRGEKIVIEPAMEWFNLFNVANYDIFSNKLSGVLTGTAGSINGTTAAYRTNRAGYGGGSFAPGIPRSWQLAVRVTF